MNGGGLERKRKVDSRVSRRSNEVQASVNPEIDLLLSLRLLLLSHVHLVLIVHELDDGSPAVEARQRNEETERKEHCELRRFGFVGLHKA